MVIEITLPQTGSEKKTKDLIIAVLSIEWPLSLKQIHNKIKKNYAYSDTYQSVYKAAKLLCDQRVLVKKDKNYMISPEWINELGHFVTDLQKKYRDEIEVNMGIIDTYKEGDTIVYIFDNMLNMDKFWLKVENDFLKENKDKKVDTCWKGNHCWWVLSHLDLEEEKNYYYDNSKITLHLICVHNTPLDRYSEKYYRDRGYKFKIIEQKNMKSDILILGDKIMQVFLPDEIKKKMDELYNNVKKIEDINLPKFSKEIINKKTKIKLTITKNPDIAEQLRQEIISKFP